MASSKQGQSAHVTNGSATRLISTGPKETYHRPVLGGNGPDIRIGEQRQEELIDMKRLVSVIELPV